MDKSDRSSQLFPVQHDEHMEAIHATDQSAFFDEAFANHPHSAQEPNRSFVGPVIPKKRYLIALFAMLGTFLLFVGRTSAWQILQGDTFRALAENNRVRERILPAERGIIYDRNGEIIAQNDPTFQLTAAVRHIPEEQEQRRLWTQRLAQLTNIPIQQLQTTLNEQKEDAEQILLSNDIAYEDAMRFAAWQEQFPGVDLEVGSKRSYLTYDLPSLSHVVGFTGVINPEEYASVEEQGYRRFDHIGKQGIEAFYERTLRGSFGKEVLEVNALGGTERIVSKTEPVDGENITLSIDTEFQREIERILTEALADVEAEKASVVAIDPRNGEILALVSWPAYDANLFANGIDEEKYRALIEDERQPLFPRASAGEFPSGSTIKPVFAAAALMEGIINEHTSFLSTGGIRIGPWFFPDWRAGGHGSTNVYHAIADSVNTFFYIIGGGNETFNGLGLEKLMEYAQKFGFGAPTGIDIPNEADGFLPSKEWKWETKGEVWYIGDTYHVAIGQGDFLVTPLQIAQSTAIIANAGEAITPHLNLHSQPEPRRVAPDDVMRIVAEGMRRTVTYGSGKVLQAVPVPVAGKTGTAQWSSTEHNHAWFTGFAPYEDPEIVLTVLVEEGADGVHHMAIPISRDILTWWFETNAEPVSDL